MQLAGKVACMAMDLAVLCIMWSLKYIAPTDAIWLFSVHMED